MLSAYSNDDREAYIRLLVILNEQPNKIYRSGGNQIVMRAVAEMTQIVNKECQARNVPPEFLPAIEIVLKNIYATCREFNL
jgi:hypothetical protein